jgi:hypothetical protein
MKPENSNLRYDKEIEESSLALSYIDHNAKLEAVWILVLCVS